MKIIADIFNKSIVIDNEAIIIDNWDEIKLPSGIRTIFYDTETKLGAVIWMDENMPNWGIGEDVYNKFVAQFVSKYRHDKIRQETARAEAIRVAGEEIAAKRLEETKAKLAEVKKNADMLARLSAVEAKIGIVHTSDEEKEQL